MTGLWEDERSPFEGAFEEAVKRNPCIRVLYHGPDGLTEDSGDSPAYTQAEWDRLRRERPEMFVAPPDPENRAATFIIEYVLPDHDGG